MTPRRLSLTLPLLSTLLVTAPARASYDECEPSWTLDLTAKSDCANIAVLAPGNDTRANLLLLLADRHGTPAPSAPAPRPLLDWKDFRTRFSEPAADDVGVFAAGEGSRCRSDSTGEKAFSAAVQADPGLSPDDRNALTNARENLPRGARARHTPLTFPLTWRM